MPSRKRNPETPAEKLPKKKPNTEAGDTELPSKRSSPRRAAAAATVAPASGAKARQKQPHAEEVVDPVTPVNGRRDDDNNTIPKPPKSSNLKLPPDAQNKEEDATQADANMRASQLVAPAADPAVAAGDEARPEQAPPKHAPVSAGSTNKPETQGKLGLCLNIGLLVVLVLLNLTTYGLWVQADLERDQSIRTLPGVSGDTLVHGDLYATVSRTLEKLNSEKDAHRSLLSETEQKVEGLELRIHQQENQMQQQAQEHSERTELLESKLSKEEKEARHWNLESMRIRVQRDENKRLADRNAEILDGWKERAERAEQSLEVLVNQIRQEAENEKQELRTQIENIRQESESTIASLVQERDQLLAQVNDLQETCSGEA